jgi:hypothetical protein
MGSYSSLTEIVPSTTFGLSLTSSVNQLFRLSSPLFQTVSITFNISSFSPNITLAVYSWNGSTATFVGSANCTSSIVTTSIDLSAGNYIFCFHSNTGNATGNFIALFTGFPQLPVFQPSPVFVGEQGTVSVLVVPKPPRICHQTIYFEKVDGEFPPGISITNLGSIRGWLPNLDCVPDPLSPSMNWWYTEEDGTTWPWGREWRFELRCWLADVIEIEDFEWFCIRVHNNWSLDQDAFLKKVPFVNVVEVRVVEDPVKLPPNLCVPCKDTEGMPAFVPQPIETPCLPCGDSGQTTTIELIPIPLDLCTCPAEGFIDWYETNKDTTFINPLIEKFKNDLANSAAFNLLRTKAGKSTSDLTEEQKARQFVAATAFQNFLQLATVRAEDTANPNDMAQLLEKWRSYENQILPMRFANRDGVNVSVNFA